MIHKATGLEHGLINTVGNSVPDNDFKHFAEGERAGMRKKRKDDEKTVKAQYINKDGGMERLERPYMIYAGQPLTYWRFFHNEIYEIPKGLVDDINNPARRPKDRSGLLDANGEELMVDREADPQHRMIPVGFN